MSMNTVFQAEFTWQAFVLTGNFASTIITIIANKAVFAVFPYPATVTCVHYMFTWAGLVALKKAGFFEPKAVEVEKTAYFWLLIVWSLCNVFSNASLEQNSVSFYQMAKIATTPAVVLVDRIIYGKHISCHRSLALVAVCVGVAIATVTDVSCTLRGCAIATISVSTGAAQKILNSHMQQHGGLSSLQLMDAAFPMLTFMGFASIPVMDSWAVFSGDWFAVASVRLLVVSATAAFFINYSTTIVLGVTSALTHVLLGQLKTCVVLLVGIWLFDKTPPVVAIFGATLAVISLTVYTVLGLDSATYPRLDSRLSTQWLPFARAKTPYESTATNAKPLSSPKDIEDVRDAMSC
eukprot:TRINITY_DN36341_c0_g1_i1.p1 TRINITY_DN36341_c0_g1~~TRINITY_DN36341_c0_g1_i1.p1  ORF type:complete len:350 (-),score=51.55 TRINITY_DN36341_c0_g1_i1:135-1184(-)